MAAVLAAGDGAALSDASAAALWGIAELQHGVIEVTVPHGIKRHRRPGLLLHRRRSYTPEAATRHNGIPVTTPADTLIDLAARHRGDRLEAAINAADRLDLIDPDALRTAAAAAGRRPGAPTIRTTLDRRTFRLTASKLERRFLPLARRAGLSPPLTRQEVNGFEVDFYWPDLKLVVETDGLRYHRTPATQARDRLRDQTHAAAGLTPLRFTHDQIAHDPHHVEATLTNVAERLRAEPPPSLPAVDHTPGAAPAERTWPNRYAPAPPAS
jgi:very-short-patch-repair endonuclease